MANKLKNTPSPKEKALFFSMLSNVAIYEDGVWTEIGGCMCSLLSLEDAYVRCLIRPQKSPMNPVSNHLVHPCSVFKTIDDDAFMVWVSENNEDKELCVFARVKNRDAFVAKYTSAQETMRELFKATESVWSKSGSGGGDDEPAVKSAPTSGGVQKSLDGGFTLTKAVEAGSWRCDVCTTQNKPNTTQCAACEAPHPTAAPAAPDAAESAPAPAFSFAKTGGAEAAPAPAFSFAASPAPTKTDVATAPANEDSKPFAFNFGASAVSTPQAPATSSAPAANDDDPQDTASILARFYAKHNPDKVGKAADLAAKYKGKEDEMWRSLMKRYNVTEADIGVPPLKASPSTPVAQTSAATGLSFGSATSLGFGVSSSKTSAPPSAGGGGGLFGAVGTPPSDAQPKTTSGVFGQGFSFSGGGAGGGGFASLAKEGASGGGSWLK